ncbi:MAG: tetratricopeptide repeat protein [Sphingobium sp.]
MGAGAVVDTPALDAYARARLADGDGALDIAVTGYAQAMAADPHNAVLALRTYRQALEAGDMPLALRSARVLDAAGVLPRDGSLLFAVDALGRKDWGSARKFAERLKAEENFAFLEPFLASWISIEDDPYAPPVPDDKSQFATLTGRYLDEHVALQALARKDVDAAMPAIRRALALRTSTLAGLRVVLAKQLAGLGRRDDALRLLDLDDPTLNAAKSDLMRGRTLKATALTPQQGFGRTLARLAEDAGDGNSRSLALVLARIAHLSDPKSDEMRVALARQLTLSGFSDAAVTEAAKIPAASPWYSVATDIRVAALGESGQREAALALATESAARPAATAAQYMQLANLLSDAKRFDLAVEAYRAAQARFAAGAVPWSLYLLEGSALERGGRWDEAKVALDKAVSLAPEEPVVLNYLGYAQVERRQNVPAALALLQKARALRPDDASIADSLGWAHYVAGDPRSAVPVLEKAAEGAPSDATINEHLGDALWAVGRRFEARYAWAAARAFAEGEAATRIADKARGGFRPELAAP